MPIHPTYPGVYIQEVPSGVRTITGVSTSVTAFVGKAKRGPINIPVHIFSYSDFEKRFGGLSEDSKLSYAVRQFFLNGGSQAVIVRLAKDATKAFKTLYNSTEEIPANEVMKITALYAGKAGNNIEVEVDYDTDIPDSNFNLAFHYKSPDNPVENRSEYYRNLSMNQFHPRYFEKKIKDISELVSVERLVDLEVPPFSVFGKSESGTLTDVGDLINSDHNEFRIAVNGLQPVTISIDLGEIMDGPDTSANRLEKLSDVIEGQVILQANSREPLDEFKCEADTSKNTITMTSGVGGENSRIEILPGVRNDVSGRLKLGSNNGGKQIDAVAILRPRAIPDPATLTSGNITTTVTDNYPALNSSKFKISIDGRVPEVVDIGTSDLSGSLDIRRGALANRIQTAVRDLKPLVTPFKDFACTISGSNLVMSPGSRGSGSSIMISEVPGDGLAAGIRLLVGVDGATRTIGSDVMLNAGNEFDFNEDEAYNIYVGSESERRGIFALEDADIFNLLCLPGITDSNILMDAAAYCQKRRAFMIVDAPQLSKKPEQMAETISGTALPKTEYAAVYYPWIKIGDPLNNGQPRTVPPSGTIAGLYARTDNDRGVWKAPAGTAANLTGVQAVEYKLTDGENGFLNPLGVNCIRVFPAYGIVSWGSRTLAGADVQVSEYKYIPIRRLALFIEESLYRGLKWVVFEPNDEPLWAQIRLNVGAFMHNLFRQGAFQGQKRQDAYFVKCDKETTTQNDIDLGIVNIWVGFAPLKPAEFVIIHLQQMAGQIQV